LQNRKPNRPIGYFPVATGCLLLLKPTYVYFSQKIILIPFCASRPSLGGKARLFVNTLSVRPSVYDLVSATEVRKWNSTLVFHISWPL